LVSDLIESAADIGKHYPLVLMIYAIITHFKNWEIPIYYTPSCTFLNFCSDVIELNKYNKIKKNKQTNKHNLFP
jgi:hypothetical protein